MKNKIKSNVYFHKIADNSNSRSISSKLREKRFNKFLSLLGVYDNCKILDVGGAEFTWIGTGLKKKRNLIKY